MERILATVEGTDPPQLAYLRSTADGKLLVSLGSLATPDRELVVTTYLCKTSFSGASVGDTITATQVLDVSATPTTVSTVWRNQTTALDLASTPSASNLTLLGSTALTDAQLRAAALIVKLQDGAGNAVTSSLVLAKQRLDVNLAAGGAPGAVAPAWADQIGGVDTAGNLRPFAVDTLGKLNALDVYAVIASDGLVITPDSYAQTLAYDASGNLSTITVTSALANTYVQTMTYNAAGQLTGVSKWVKQ